MTGPAPTDLLGALRYTTASHDGVVALRAAAHDPGHRHRGGPRAATGDFDEPLHAAIVAALSEPA